jgi:hypothetical protein
MFFVYLSVRKSKILSWLKESYVDGVPPTEQHTMVASGVFTEES